MPEMPEIEAHAERLSDRFGGRTLERFVPLNFTALKTAVPQPDEAYGSQLVSIGRRGKYLLLEFGPITFIVHLMQGGRLLPDEKRAAKPRGGQARFVFEAIERDDGTVDDTALLLTEQGKERRAGVWCVRTGEVDGSPPLDQLGPEAAGISADALAERFGERSMRIHGFLRDQRMVAGIGRRLANEICWTARVSPFATTKSLGRDGAETVAAAIETCVSAGLDEERSRSSMSASKDRSSNVHNRTGEECVLGHDTIRAVEYSGYTVNYCPTCQTGGKILADNTTSKFLK